MDKNCRKVNIFEGEGKSQKERNIYIKGNHKSLYIFFVCLEDEREKFTMMKFNTKKKSFIYFLKGFKFHFHLKKLLSQ